MHSDSIQNTWLTRSSGSFLPLTLEQLAREHGSLQTSHAPCWGPGSPSDKGTKSDEQCTVGIMGLRINTASFAMYTFSLAVLIQALTLVSSSALADYGTHNLLAIHTIEG